MKIFVDESGSFVIPQDRRCSVSCVSALLIPDNLCSKIYSGFEDLKGQWGAEGREVKGRELEEIQISTVIKFLNDFDVIFETFAIDMGLELEEEVRSHRDEQAEKVMENITPQHLPELVESLKEAQSRIRNLPSQLYIESALLTSLIWKVLQDMTLYYAQRLPECLGSFQWRIDAKDKTLTEYEGLWRDTIRPVLVGISQKTPNVMLRGADYRWFLEFCAEPTTSNVSCHFDVGKVLKDLAFEQSTSNLGLQLVDILCNAVRRAMNGRLGRLGWELLGCLCVQGQKDESVVRMVRLSKHGGRLSTHDAALPYVPVLQTFRKTCKNMILQDL